MTEQMVLRAQMPKTLGAWEQNLYQVGKGEAPTLCWDAKGKAVALPKSASVAFVGYRVGLNISGSVTVYQYASQAAADAALAKLRSYSCPNSAKHPDENEQIVKADQGTDFTDDSRTGIANGIVFTDSDGRQNYVDSWTTQIGLAVVQTTVGQVLDKPASITGAQNLASKLGKVDGAWHKKVVAAYRNFGIEATAR